MLFILLERSHARQLSYGSGHGRQRLPDFVGDGRREAPQRRHAVLGGDFLFQPAEIGKVLEVEDIAIALRVARAEWRNADAEVALLAIGGAKLNLATQRKTFAAIRDPGNPKLLAEFGEFAPANVGEAITQDLLAGTVQQ